MRLSRFRLLVAAVVPVAVAAAAVGVSAVTAHAAVACNVTYRITNQWQGGFQGDVTLQNPGDAWTSWTLGFDFPNSQRITQLWSARLGSPGPTGVSVSNEAWNASIATGASTTFGFIASWNTTNTAPTAFTVNGVACNGGTPPTTAPTTRPTTVPTTGPTTRPTTAPTTGPTTPPTTPPTTGPTGELPSSFQWRSSGALISPRSDATHDLVSIKDPSVVFYNNRWHLFGSTVNAAGRYNLVYLNFTDWAQAGSATQYHLGDNPNIGTGYKAAPQAFYFAPQNRWYLVYQTGPPSFSTTSDLSQPQSWSRPTNFFAAEPQIVLDNKGTGQWIDFWVICDATNCYLFFSDNNGHTYRSRTSVANFPNGFNDPVIIQTDSRRYNLWEAANVYKLRGQNKYLMIVEAIGSDGKRYFRSWTSDRLDGSWTALAATEANPFARASNVTFDGAAWTRDISHGEMVRDGYDQTLQINPCQLRYVYQGVDPNSTASYTFLPWRLSLLTQTNSTC